MASAQNGNFDQAIMELHLAIQNEPGWVMPLFTLGVVYGNQGELDKAIQVWERATQLDADFAKAHYNLAVAYLHKEEKNTIHYIAAESDSDRQRGNFLCESGPRI
jgi:Flp pilus assembly protein TadD